MVFTYKYRNFEIKQQIIILHKLGQLY